MSSRFALAAIAAVLALTGCAKSKTADPTSAFDFGSSRVTVTHVPTKTDDGTTIYVTIDSKDAGALGTGKSLELQLPEGKHTVGGYARTLIGRVTISPVEVSTSSDVVSHVTYSIANSKPTFTVRASTPVPKPKSETIPVESVPVIQQQIEEPAAVEQTQVTPSATVEQTQVTPSATAEQTQVTPPATTEQTQVTPSATTEQTQVTPPAAPAATQETQSPKVTELTPTTQSQTETQTSAPQGVGITNLTDNPQA
ncbi:hypothetical protein M977_00937 [Buttiauxella gaviniae ATCC 51604]|uniref:Lipoprotein n=1 Tax=Buttiauxella gaviniae ATCC 51604 TaxID=1354253 RepID=A0A1B7I4A3_9ENTR|nr:hypothetical protein [Buttiauxella gaviniae]OAT23165.1 hypothetical protein M977_00937 [Buttiauxella gaviniae ATCC 51604]